MRLFRAIEMWCRRQAAAAILPLLLAGWLTGESSQALTTFGKSNTQPPKEITPTAPPARPCSRQNECAGITGSSCVRTQNENFLRCRCGDNSPPVNGQCDPQPKVLFHVCGNSDDCADGLVCGTANTTGYSASTLPVHLRVYSQNDKSCVCDTENGYVEKDFVCSDADIFKVSLLAIFIATCIRKVVA